MNLWVDVGFLVILCLIVYRYERREEIYRETLRATMKAMRDLRDAKDGK